MPVHLRADTGQVLPVTPLPAAGEVVLDTRGSGRALRVAWHFDRRFDGHVDEKAPGQDAAASDLVVLSLWHGGICTGSFRLDAADVPTLVAALQDGLARAETSPRLSSDVPGGLTG